MAGEMVAAGVVHSAVYAEVFVEVGAPPFFVEREGVEGAEVGEESVGGEGGDRAAYRGEDDVVGAVAGEDGVFEEGGAAFEALFVDECYVEEFLHGGVAFGYFVVDDVAGELFHRDVLVQGRGVVGVEDYEFFAAEVVFCEFVEAGGFGGGVGRGGLFCRFCDFRRVGAAGHGRQDD